MKDFIIVFLLAVVATSFINGLDSGQPAPQAAQVQSGFDAPTIERTQTAPATGPGRTPHAAASGG